MTRGPINARSFALVLALLLAIDAAACTKARPVVSPPSPSASSPAAPRAPNMWSYD